VATHAALSLLPQADSLLCGVLSRGSLSPPVRRRL